MSVADDDTWRYQWPAGTRFLAEIADIVDVRGRCVVDLGCGQGRLGRWALANGASRVVFADLSAEALASVPADARAEALPHRWGEPLPACDVLLGGDILYRPACFPALLDSVRCALGPASQAWLVDPRSSLEPELPILAAERGLRWSQRRQPGGYTLALVQMDGMKEIA